LHNGDKEGDTSDHHRHLDYTIHDAAFEGFPFNYYGNAGNLNVFCIFTSRCHRLMWDFNNEPKWGIGDIAQ